MTLLRTTLLLAILAFVMSLSPLAAQNVHTQDMDRSVKPGDDFYRFANGAWLKVTTAPAGQPSYGTSAMLIEKTAERVRNLIQESAAVGAAQGTITQKVGDYYAAFMAEEAIETRGLKPLADEMAAISAITNKTSLSAYLGATLDSEVDGLTEQRRPYFRCVGQPEFRRLAALRFPPVAGRSRHARSRQLPRSLAQNGRVTRADIRRTLRPS